MERMTFNLTYWPVFILAGFCQTMMSETLSDELALIWGALTLICFGVNIALLWHRLSVTNVSKWLSLLLLVPLGGLVMGLIAGITKTKEAV